jgi:hypothetical protein
MITTCEITLRRNPENLIHTAVRTDHISAFALSFAQLRLCTFSHTSPFPQKSVYKIKARLTVAVFF